MTEKIKWTLILSIKWDTIFLLNINSYVCLEK